jgi:hypothetical protein
MTAPDLSGVQQMAPRDVEVRGWLALTGLPNDVQNAEDSTANADKERRWSPSLHKRGQAGGPFKRPATPTERMLLEHLGYGPLPDDLVTTVRFYTRAVRNRRWYQLEGQP